MANGGALPRHRCVVTRATIRSRFSTPPAAGQAEKFSRNRTGFPGRADKQAPRTEIQGDGVRQKTVKKTQDLVGGVLTPVLAFCCRKKTCLWPETTLKKVRIPPCAGGRNLFFSASFL
jgi:hypothetical protein